MYFFPFDHQHVIGRVEKDVCNFADFLSVFGVAHSQSDQFGIEIASFRQMDIPSRRTERIFFFRCRAVSMSSTPGSVKSTLFL